MLESLLMVLLFLSGNGSNLLDTVDTDSYWQAKQVTVTVDQLLKDAAPPAAAPDLSAPIKDLGDPRFATRAAAQKTLLAAGPAALDPLTASLQNKDPEVVTAARAIIATLQTQSKAADIRQLMAIRTLGEKKSPQALPLLKTLATSTTPFVADYAARSLAQIENRALPVPALDRTAAGRDAWLFPQDYAIIAQQSAGMGKSLTLNAFIDLAAPLPEGHEGLEEKAKMKTAAAKSTIALLEQLGNVRVDSVALAFSSQFNQDRGFAILTLRGKWDKKTMAESLRATFESQGDLGENADPFNGLHPAPATQHIPPALDLHAPIILKGPDTAAIVVSDEQLIFVIGTDDGRAQALAQMTAALKTGMGTVADDKDMAAALKAADMSQPVWGILRVSKDLKNASDLFTHFNTATLTGALKDNALQLTLTAASADAAAAKLGTQTISDTITQTLKDLTAADTHGDLPESDATCKTMTAILHKITIKPGTTLSVSLTQKELLALLRQLPTPDLLDLLTSPSDDDPPTDITPR